MFDGINEVGWVIVVLMVMIVGVFFLMVFWFGVMGKFMGYLFKMVMIMLVVSLFVVFVINFVVVVVFLCVKCGKDG